ncbi:Uncharacterized protein PCOAH_00025760 [Plasmodium coatneyi]|uniref:C2 NT-type domain-containing protein n=1 Tax=Plasmodium coatneyi TaxID=208452 RepID=A0A1B1E0T5_9APIC|nr:Uncharacterized protein PCOAH_00025760 [Plasmodium coatneyi]ANQ08467.1 Uncharacterized protein PCOAH_00025760 [Plasmodium coatneyi]
MGKIKRLFRRARRERQKHKFDISVNFIELKNDNNDILQVAYELVRNSKFITSSEQAQLRKGRAYFKNPLVMDLTLYCKKKQTKIWEKKKFFFFIFYKICGNKNVVIGKTKIDFSQFVSTSNQLYNVSFVILKNMLNCGTAHLKVRCGSTMGAGAHDITATSVDSGAIIFPTFATRSCSLPPGGETSSGEMNDASKNDSDDGGGNGSMHGSSFSSEEMNVTAYTWEDSTTNAEKEKNNWSSKSAQYDRSIYSCDNSIAALERSINSSLKKLRQMNGPRWHHRPSGANANGVTMQGKPPRGGPMAHTNGEKKNTECENPPCCSKKNTQMYHLQKKINRRKNKKETHHSTLEVQSVIRNMEKAIKNAEMIQRINRSVLQQNGEEEATEGGHTTRRTQVQTPTKRYDSVNKLKKHPHRKGINSAKRQVECHPREEQNDQSSHPSNYNMHVDMEEKNCKVGTPPNEESPMENNFHPTCGALNNTNWTLGHNELQRSVERGELFEPSMMALRQLLLLISAQTTHEWDDYHRVGSYATPLRHPYDGCIVSRRREEVHTKGLLPSSGGRNYHHMVQKNGVDGTDQMSTHLGRMEFPIGYTTNVACPHSYAIREEENFLFRLVNGRGPPKGGEVENLPYPVGAISSQGLDCNWREGIDTRDTNLGSNVVPNRLANQLQKAQFSSQHDCLLKTKLNGEGVTTPHDGHADLHNNERTIIHSKMKKTSSEENKTTNELGTMNGLGTMNELGTIHKLVEDMQNVQLVIKELTGTMVSGCHKKVSNHGDANTTEQAHSHSHGGNIISLLPPFPDGGQNKERATHKGNDSNDNLSSGDVEKYEEKIANLVQELMNTKLLLAQSETKREEDINEMNRRCGS